MNFIDELKNKYHLTEEKTINVGIIDSGLDMKFINNTARVKYTDLLKNHQKPSIHGQYVFDIIYHFIPNADFNVYRILDENNNGNLKDLLNAIVLAVEDKCSIINLSLNLNPDINFKKSIDNNTGVIHCEYTPVSKNAERLLGYVLDCCRSRNIYIVCSYCKSYNLFENKDIIFVTNEYEENNHDNCLSVKSEILNHFFADSTNTKYNSYSTAFVTGLLSLIKMNYPNSTYADNIKRLKEMIEITINTL